jgi:uncharacterized membrane protein AbrB (regulator of aidB expression)
MEPDHTRRTSFNTALRVVVLLGTAAAVGLTAEALNVPAGALLGALGGAFVVNVAWPGPRLAKAFRTGGKALSGAVIGLSFSPAMLGLPPALPQWSCLGSAH